MVTLRLSSDGVLFFLFHLDVSDLNPFCIVSSFEYFDIMTSHQRKENSEKRIAAVGISSADTLPVIDEAMVTSIKSPQKVAERILILTYLNCIASDPGLRQEVMMFLIREKLWDEVTAEEKTLFHNPRLSEHDIDNIFWRKESIWMLLWAIGEVDDVALPDQEVDLYEIFPLLPGFFEPTLPFIQQAVLRSRDTILNEQDFYFRLNWALRQQPDVDTPLIHGVVHERDLALSWLAGMLGEWV
jgi:hypothetical protein